MRVLSIRVVAAVGPEAGTAVPALVKALDAPETEVRLEAVHALVKLGPAARPAADALRKALDDSDRDVRRRAAEALLRPEISILHRPDWSIRIRRHAR